MRAARLHLHDTKVLQIITIPKDRKKRHESINSKLFLYSCIVRWMISIYFCHESSHTSWLRWELHRDKDLCIATTFTELMFPLQIKLLWSNTFCFNLLLLFFASNWVSLSSFASNTVTNHFYCCMNLIWPGFCFYCCSKVIRCCYFSGRLKIIHPCHSSDLY